MVDWDPYNLESLDDVAVVHEKISQEENALIERLDWSVGNRHHLEAKLSQLAHLVPTLQLVQEDAKKLQNTITFTQKLANNVSAKVRQLDLAKSRVLETQQRVADLLDLEGCSGGVSLALSQEDYETAAAHIHRFLAMDESVLRHSANTSGKESIESWFDRLHEAEKQLSTLIVSKFDEAVRDKDPASVDRFFKLFPLLNRHEQGLQKFTTYLCSMIQETSAFNLKKAMNIGPQDKRSHVIWADTITILFEQIARTIEVRQPIIETYYGPGYLSVVVDMLQLECDRQAGLIISEMKASRKLDVISQTVQETLRVSGDNLATGKNKPKPHVADPRDLDTLLGELTLMNARAELYMRFVKRRVFGDIEVSVSDLTERTNKERNFDAKLSRSQLACDMAALVGVYTIVEQFYLNESFKKALAMDSIDGEGSHTSSLVDDAFYIIKKSIRRGIASSSVDGVCAMINHCVNLIESQLCSGFHQTLRKGFPAQGYLDLTMAYTVLQSSLQGNKSSTQAADSDTLRQEFLIALNNCNTSIQHVTSLHQSLVDNITSAMSPGKTDQAKLNSCLGDLKSTSNKLNSVVEFGMSQLRAMAIKPKVKPWVDQFTATSHDLTENDFAGYEANDPFSETLIMQVDSLLASFMPLLTNDNYKALVKLIVAEVAAQLEKAVLKSSFNRLGGLQFDREVRSIVAYLSQVSEWGVRELLARLTQIATLLNLEVLAEVSEYSNTTTWRLTPSEMRQVLKLRIDFKADDINKLKL